MITGARYSGFHNNSIVDYANEYVKYEDYKRGIEIEHQKDVDDRAGEVFAEGSQAISCLGSQSDVVYGH